MSDSEMRSFAAIYNGFEERLVQLQDLGEMLCDEVLPPELAHCRDLAVEHLRLLHGDMEFALNTFYEKYRTEIDSQLRAQSLRFNEF